MAAYYVNNRAQNNGDHQVHVQGCSFMPGDKKYLGEHHHCGPAVIEAKKTYRQSNGCYYCCPACHTQ